MLPFDAPRDSVEKIINNITGNDSIYFVPYDAINNKEIYLKKGKNYQDFTYRFYGDSTAFWEEVKTGKLT